MDWFFVLTGTNAASIKKIRNFWKTVRLHLLPRLLGRRCCFMTSEDEANRFDEEVAAWKASMSQEQLSAYYEFIDCMADLYRKYSHLIEN